MWYGRISFIDFVKLKLKINYNINFWHMIEGTKTRVCAWELSGFGPAPPHKAIGANVYQNDDEPQYKLDLRGEACGIDEGEGIMLNKSSTVSGVTAGLAEVVFQGSEGADPPAKLQGRSPKRCRKMNPRDPATPNREKSAEQHKDDEAEVNEKDQVSKDLPKHGDAPNQKSSLGEVKIPKGKRGSWTG